MYGWYEVQPKGNTGDSKPVTDPRVKLQARAIVSDCYKFILDMSTNAGVVSDALKYVTQQKEQVNALQKIDEQSRRGRSNYNQRSILKCQILILYNSKRCIRL